MDRWQFCGRRMLVFEWLNGHVIVFLEELDICNEIIQFSLWTIDISKSAILSCYLTIGTVKC
jgi:hypothetical protein